jgi:CheY-like chemotaxis protein
MTNKINKSFTILMAEDDPEDLELIRDAFEENRFEGQIRSVGDGEELMDYLRNNGKFSDPSLCPKPDHILLDLNMPRMDGREALAAIKADRKLKAVPIVVLTTSSSEDDIIGSYALGANTYFVKPTGYNALVNIVEILGKYWFKAAILLPKNSRNGH